MNQKNLKMSEFSFLKGDFFFKREQTMRLGMNLVRCKVFPVFLYFYSPFLGQVPGHGGYSGGHQPARLQTRE